jgi:hypothetical protein
MATSSDVQALHRRIWVRDTLASPGKPVVAVEESGQEETMGACGWDNQLGGTFLPDPGKGKALTKNMRMAFQQHWAVAPQGPETIHDRPVSSALAIGEFLRANFVPESGTANLLIGIGIAHFGSSH